MNFSKIINITTQFAIPSFTIGAQVALSFKYPEWVLVINLCAQPFWLYSGWKAYRKAGQIGLFITTIIITFLIIGGIINYWFL